MQELYWIGLDWIGLDWIGLDWVNKLSSIFILICSLIQLTNELDN